MANFIDIGLKKAMEWRDIIGSAASGYFPAPVFKSEHTMEFPPERREDGSINLNNYRFTLSTYSKEHLSVKKLVLNVLLGVSVLAHGIEMSMIIILGILLSPLNFFHSGKDFYQSYIIDTLKGQTKTLKTISRIFRKNNQQLILNKAKFSVVRDLYNETPKELLRRVIEINSPLGHLHKILPTKKGEREEYVECYTRFSMLEMDQLIEVYRDSSRAEFSLA